MIRPPEHWGKGFGGAAFSSGADGDLRLHDDQREAFSTRLGLSMPWASVSQVHGAQVVSVDVGGNHGDADGLWTTQPRLALSVFTADCVGIVLVAADAVGVAHAGWRGMRAGVIENVVEVMRHSGHRVLAAAIGPSIGPCCFEVGREVVDAFPSQVAETTWGTTSVDLRLTAERILGDGVDVWRSEVCTKCSPGWFSHREDGTLDRLACVGWLN